MTDSHISGIAWHSGWTLHLARLDGFENVEDFRSFFERQYGFPFEGLVIRWGEVRK